MRRAAAMLLVLTALAAPAASASPAPASPSPQTCLLNVWLDIQLLPMVAPGSSPAQLAVALQKVARQLGQPPPMIRHGRTPADTRRYPPGTVLIKPDTPADTLVMFARSGSGEVWKLVDDGHMRVSRVGGGKSSPFSI